MKPEESARAPVIASVVALLVNVVSIYIGNVYVVAPLVVGASVFLLLVFWNSSIAKVCVLSIFAANPTNLNSTIAANLIFAVVIAAADLRQMRSLPKWVLLLTTAGVFCFLGTIPEWYGTSFKIDEGNQFVAFTNYFLSVLLIIPLGYTLVRRWSSSISETWVFLFALVLPSVAFLFAATLFGKPLAVPTNKSIAGIATIEPILVLGRTEFQVVRTQIGFILAALICAVVPIILIPGRAVYRVISILVFIGTLYLFSITGSFGSMLSAFIGVVVQLVVATLRIRNLKLAIAAVVVLGVVILLWEYAPGPTQTYLEARYTQRAGGNGIEMSDRVDIWIQAYRFMMEHATGIGFSLWVGGIGGYPHNDFLTYGIAYGVVGGAIYLAAVLGCLLKLSKALLKRESLETFVIRLSGLGVGLVVLINSFSDHLTANRWYFNILWSMIWFACLYKSRENNGFSNRNMRRKEGLSTT